MAQINEAVAMQGLQLGANLIQQGIAEAGDTAMEAKQFEMSAFITKEVLPLRHAGVISGDDAIRLTTDKAQQIGVDPGDAAKLITGFFQAGAQMNAKPRDILTEAKKEIDLARSSAALVRETRTPERKALEKQAEETTTGALSTLQTIHSIGTARAGLTPTDRVDELAEDLEEQLGVDLPGIAFHGKIGSVENLATLLQQQLSKLPQFQSYKEADLRTALRDLLLSPGQVDAGEILSRLATDEAPLDPIAAAALARAQKARE